MGRPIIQYPQDMIVMQELIWDLKPDLIIETGIAHGGSLIFYASLMELIGKGEVLGIDIDIRAHNRKEIRSASHVQAHQDAGRLCGKREIAAQVRKAAEGKQTVMVLLDSNHTHDHVLRGTGALCATGNAGLLLRGLRYHRGEAATGLFQRTAPWGIGNNPLTAVHAYLKKDDRFVIDAGIDNQKC